MSRRLIRFVCVSDTHCRPLQVPIPTGDVLLHTGDFSRAGSAESIAQFNAWMHSLPHPYKVVIAGNHEHTFHAAHWPMLKQTYKHGFDYFDAKKLLTAAIYLENSACEVFGYRVWGSPWVRAERPGAFALQSDEELEPIYSAVTGPVDILLTHGPAYGVLDCNIEGKYQGSKTISRLITRLKPLVHVCGHIHEGYGEHLAPGAVTLSLNASICSVGYEGLNSPLVFDLPR